MGQQYRDRESEIDLIDYLKIIYKRRWLVLALTVMGMLYACITSVRQSEIYEASATFFPLSMNNNVASQGFTVKPQLDIKDMALSILKSRNMAERVVEQLDLQKLWNARLKSDAVRALRGSVTVALEQNGLIRLSVCSISPELAAKIANSYVDSLEYFNSQLNITAQRQIVQVIDRATVPDTKTPRNTVKKVMMSGVIYFIIAVSFVFSEEIIKKSEIIKRIKEK